MAIFAEPSFNHVVIRKDQTIFLIEGKSHKGRVTADGKQILVNEKVLHKNPIRQVNRSIKWVRRVLTQIWGKNAWIVAVLVFSNAQVHIRRSVKRVNVMEAKRLLEFIRTYPDRT